MLKEFFIITTLQCFLRANTYCYWQLVLLFVSFYKLFSRKKTDGGPQFFFQIFLLNSLDVFIMSHKEAECLRCFLIRLPLYTGKVKSLYNPENELLPILYRLTCKLYTWGMCEIGYTWPNQSSLHFSWSPNQILLS